MNALTRKLRLIYLPFLIIAFSVVVIYTFLNWLLFIKNDFFPLKEDMVTFWLPAIVPWIPVLIWLRPRINLLKFKNDNVSFLYYVVAAFAIAAPTIAAQKYLATASGTLTKVENINQLEKKEATKYYSISKYFIDKTHIGVNNTVNVSGKSNQHLNFVTYVVMPVRANPADSSSEKCLYFLGEKYQKTTSNSLSEKEKDSQYEQFIKDVREEFNSSGFLRIGYFEKMANSDDRDGFRTAVSKTKFKSNNTPVIFTAQYGYFAERNGTKLGWTFLALGIGAAVWFGFLVAAKFKKQTVGKPEQLVNETSEQATNVNPRQPAKEDSFKEMLALFKPREGYYITPIIMDLNIIIFLIMVFAGLGVIAFKPVDLIHWGGNYKPYTTNGQWWRLLTSVFLHGGLMHLVANMIGLLFAGIFLEPVVGKKKYAIIYLVTGILASCVSLWWHEKTISVGASGAIFGLYGLLLALLLMKVFPPASAKAFLFSTLFFVGYNLLMGLKGGIDNAAHIGGLVSGFVIGALISSSLKKEATTAESGIV